MRILVVSVIMMLSAVIWILYLVMKYYRERTEEEIDKVKKGLEFYRILVRWLELKQQRCPLAAYFEENHYQTAAVYGMKELGVLLVRELQQEGVEVRYAVDRNAEEISADIPVLGLSREMPEVDVIIVTAPHYFDQIYLDLKEVTKAEIVSVEDVLWGIENKTVRKGL